MTAFAPRTLAAALLLSAALVRTDGTAQEAKKPTSSKARTSGDGKDKKRVELTFENVDQIRKLCDPVEGHESAYLEKVPWAKSFGEALRKAAEQGKPIWMFSSLGCPLGGV